MGLAIFLHNLLRFYKKTNSKNNDEKWEYNYETVNDTISWLNSKQYQIQNEIKKFFKPSEIATTIDINWLKESFGEDISNFISSLNTNPIISPQEKIQIATDYVLISKWELNINDALNPKVISDYKKQITNKEEPKYFQS